MIFFEVKIYIINMVDAKCREKPTTRQLQVLPVVFVRLAPGADVRERLMDEGLQHVVPQSLVQRDHLVKHRRVAERNITTVHLLYTYNTSLHFILIIMRKSKTLKILMIYIYIHMYCTCNFLKINFTV